MNCTTLRTVAILAIGFTSFAHAQLIDIAFHGPGDPTPSGAAVIGSAGDQWNGIDGSANGTTGPLALINSDGSSSPATLTFTAEGSVVALSASNQPLPALTHTYLFNNDGGHVTVTLNGLAADQQYLLELYVASDDAAGGDRAVAADANNVLLTASGNPQTSFVNGQNYVEGDPISDGSGAITIILSDEVNLNTSQEVDLSGLQIEPLPEPVCLGTLSLGGLVLFGRRRHGASGM